MVDEWTLPSPRKGQLEMNMQMLYRVALILGTVWAIRYFPAVRKIVEG